MTVSTGVRRGFAYWLDVLTNLAVVGGIVFLALELRQNSRMMRAQVRNDITQQVFGSIDRAMEPAVVDARLKIARGEETSPEDEYVLGLLVRATFRGFENTEYQYRMGLFDESEYASNVRFIRTYLGDSYNRDWWLANREEFSRDLRELVDSILALRS